MAVFLFSVFTAWFINGIPRPKHTRMELTWNYNSSQEGFLKLTSTGCSSTDPHDTHQDPTPVVGSNCAKLQKLHQGSAFAHFAEYHEGIIEKKR